MRLNRLAAEEQPTLVPEQDPGEGVKTTARESRGGECLERPVSPKVWIVIQV